MHPMVRQVFRRFNEPMEGVVPFMYLDIKGLVTVGVGNLVDPVNYATSLPFQWKVKAGVPKSGQKASAAEISEEWNRLKADKTLAQKGHRACKAITNLELTDAAINNLIATRLESNEKILKKYAAFQNFDKWPADAQLALHSMSWAMGAGGPAKFATLCTACKKLDFATAADNCKMKEAGNPGIVPRNRANKQLFLNAAAVMAGEGDGFYDKSRLYYPTVLMMPVIIS